jgi:hypothetical protein
VFVRNFALCCVRKRGKRDATKEEKCNLLHSC